MWITLQVTILGLFLVSLTIMAEECSTQRLQQCRSAVEDELRKENDQQQQRRTPGVTQRQEMQNHCRSIMDNLHCVVWQSANCLSIDDRERNSEQIWKAWKYLTNVCDSLVGWRISQCFQRDDLRRCEALIRDTSRNTNQDNCRKFISFKDCVNNIVRAQCPIEDQTTATIYFLDQGREKAWKCSSAETRDRPDYQSQQSTYADQEFGDAQDALCLARSSGPIRGCSDHYYRRQDDARKHRDTQDKMHHECCASINFERCVRDTVRDYCIRYRDSVVQTILDQNGVRMDPRCRYYSDNECSSAANISIDFLVTTIIAGVTFITTRRLF